MINVVFKRMVWTPLCLFILSLKALLQGRAEVETKILFYFFILKSSIFGLGTLYIPPPPLLLLQIGFSVSFFFKQVGQERAVRRLFIFVGYLHDLQLWPWLALGRCPPTEGDSHGGSITLTRLSALYPLIFLVQLDWSLGSVLVRDIPLPLLLKVIEVLYIVLISFDSLIDILYLYIITKSCHYSVCYLHS